MIAGAGEKEHPLHCLTSGAARHSQGEAGPASSRHICNKPQHTLVAGAGEEAWAIKERKNVEIIIDRYQYYKSL